MFDRKMPSRGIKWPKIFSFCVIPRTDEKSALYAECGQLQQTSATLRADLESTRANLQSYHQQQKHYEEKLNALENEVKSLQHSKVCPLKLPNGCKAKKILCLNFL